MIMRCLTYFKQMKKSKITFAVVLLYFCTSVQAELILTAPPRESKAKGQAQYGPMAKRLSEVLGEKVVYQQPKGWLFYQRDMRADKYDIVFDGPHFMSWRMKKFNHTPVASLPGKLGFIVVTKKENSKIASEQDLVNIKLCAIAPPNLSTLTVLAEMKNPARQPILVTGKGGMKGVWKRYEAGKCDAAILRDKFFLKKVDKEKQALEKIVYKSVPVANQGVTVSTRVTPEMRQKIIAELTTPGSPATMPTIKRFAAKAKGMKPAKDEQYSQSYQLLTGVIFGWEVDDGSLLANVK